MAKSTRGDADSPAWKQLSQNRPSASRRRSAGSAAPPRTRLPSRSARGSNFGHLPMSAFESVYRFTVRMLPLDRQREAPMTKPIPDKAEIALEYPDKLYVGTFERSSRFEAHLDPTGIALVLEKPGADDVRKSIHMDRK